MWKQKNVFKRITNTCLVLEQRNIFRTVEFDRVRGPVMITTIHDRVSFIIIFGVIIFQHLSAIYWRSVHLNQWLETNDHRMSCNVAR